MAGAGATLAADGIWISWPTLVANGLSSQLVPHGSLICVLMFFAERASRNA